MLLGLGPDHPTDINHLGVDYPVGSTIPDARLLDAKTNKIPSCGNYSSIFHYIRCNSGAYIEGYRFIELGFIQPVSPSALHGEEQPLHDDSLHMLRRFY